MTNAELFQKVFGGLMATELWAMPEKEYLEWLNAECEHPEWWLRQIPAYEALKALKDNGWTECTYNGEVFAMVKPRIERSPDDTLMGLW